MHSHPVVLCLVSQFTLRYTSTCCTLVYACIWLSPLAPLRITACFGCDSIIRRTRPSRGQIFHRLYG
jgi:hypothetical protein